MSIAGDISSVPASVPASIPAPISLPHGAVLRQRWHLCWSSIVTSWTDPFGACAEAGRRQALVRLVVAVELAGPALAAVEAWLELPAGRESILGPCAVPCAASYDGRVLHIDAARDGEVLLAASLDVADHRLLYARSALLQSAGFAAGTFDPPALEADT